MHQNILFEMFPLIAFFAVYYFTKNLFTATIVCIIASWLQLLAYQLVYKKIAKNTWLSTGLITILGGLTVVLHNKTFVMLKPTVLYWLFGISLYLAAKMGKNGIQLLFQGQIQLPQQEWQKINWLWIGFFILMGILNLIVAYYCREAIWVNFKVFGGLALMLVCSLITAVFMYAKTKGTVNG